MSVQSAQLAQYLKQGNFGWPKSLEKNKLEPKNSNTSSQLGFVCLFRKDDNRKKKTKGGIALPDSAEIPTITGRIVTISAAIEHDEDIPLKQYDQSPISSRQRDPGRF